MFLLLITIMIYIELKYKHFQQTRILRFIRQHMYISFIVFHTFKYEQLYFKSNESL